MHRNPSGHVESEITLVICSERPAEIADRIAGLRNVRDCGLFPDSDLRIHDAYLDTSEGIFGRSLRSFRVRKIAATGAPLSPDRAPGDEDERSSEVIIALKGPSTTAAHGGVDRIELEAPWSLAGLAACVQELRDLGIILPVADFRSDDPTRTLRSMGLVVIQERFTQRRIRLVRLSHEGPVQAELAIDRVSYFFGSARVIHREIEIETKAPEAGGVVKTLALELATMFGSELRPWRPGKLTTGTAVERLLNAGRLEGLMNEDRDLLTGAYTLIENSVKGLFTDSVRRTR